MTPADCASRLLSLRPLVHEWIDRQDPRRQKPPSRDGVHPMSNQAATGAYADLMLAFGLARLGAVAACDQLLQRAEAVLEAPAGGNDSPGDGVHNFLLRAFEYRIRQALEGKPHARPLSPELLGHLETLGRELPRMNYEQQLRTRDSIYRIDKFRQRSAILDPQARIEPFRRYFGHILGDLEQELAVLFDVSDPRELATRLERLLQTSSSHPSHTQAAVLLIALELSPRVGEALSLDLLNRVPPLLAQLTDPETQANLLGTAAMVAAYFGQKDHVRGFLASLHPLLDLPRSADLVRGNDAPLDQFICALQKLGLREELEHLLNRVAERILQEQDVASLCRQILEGASSRPHHEDSALPLRNLLLVTGGWFSLGHAEQASQILKEVRTVLLAGVLRDRQQVKLACAYARALGQAPAELCLREVEGMFQKLEGVTDTLSIRTHFSLSELSFTEAAVLSVVEAAGRQ